MGYKRRVTKKKRVIDGKRETTEEETSTVVITDLPEENALNNLFFRNINMETLRGILKKGIIKFFL